jgi:hypothetical protein
MRGSPHDPHNGLATSFVMHRQSSSEKRSACCKPVHRIMPGHIDTEKFREAAHQKA